MATQTELEKLALQLQATLNTFKEGSREATAITRQLQIIARLQKELTSGQKELTTRLEAQIQAYEAAIIAGTSRRVRVGDIQARIASATKAYQKALENFGNAGIIIDNITKQLEDAQKVIQPVVKKEITPEQGGISTFLAKTMDRETISQQAGYNRAMYLLPERVPSEEENRKTHERISFEEKETKTVQRLREEIERLNKVRTDPAAYLRQQYTEGYGRQGVEEALRGEELYEEAQRQVPTPQPIEQDLIDKFRKVTIKDQAELERIFEAVGIKTASAEKVLKSIEGLGFTPQDLVNIKGLAGKGRGNLVWDLPFRKMVPIPGTGKINPETGEEEGVQTIPVSATVSINKYGDVLIKTKRQLQDFGAQLMRNVGEFAKWSLAVTLILGPIQKLSELAGIMINNQTQLVDIEIALGNAQKSTTEIFESAAKVGDITGESLNGVLDAFTLAYRATGGTGDEFKRFTDSTRLLNDALILSKLSTLDQAGAIDILTASLKQTGLSLTQGSVLLDKWVRTTKVANVDLETLATSFAIVGDAAEAAGLDTDRLNGLIAAVAETGIASGREAGNAVRAVVSGFQSDKASKELEKLGIALKTVSGEARTFDDIMQDVVKLRVSGTITEENFRKLTLALGGGSRRSALFTTLIENYKRVDQVAQESMKAQGDSSDAVSKQLETVSTSTTKLGNAFISLAQTLGTSGGVLDSFKTLFDLGTGIVKVIDALAGAFGRVTPLLATTIAGLAVIRGKGENWTITQRGRIAGFLSGLSERAIGGEGTIGSRLINRAFVTRENREDLLSKRLGFTITPETMPETQTTKLASGRIASFLTSGKGIGFGLTALAATGNLLDATASSKEKTARIAADLVGGIAGTFIAGPYGAMIGAAISEGFVNSIVLYKGKLQNLFPIPTIEEAPGTIKGTTAKEEEQIMEDLLTKAGSGSRISGVLRSEIFKFIANTSLLVTGSKNRFTTEQAALALSGKTNFFSPLTSRIDPELAKRLQEIETRRQRLEGTTTEFTKETLPFTGLISNIRKQLEAELREQLISREITPSTYSQRFEQLKGIQERSSLYYSTFGKPVFQEMQGKKPEDIFKTFGNIITFGMDEEINQLNIFATAIQDFTEQLKDNSMDAGTYKETLVLLNQTQQDAAAYTEKLNQALIARTKILQTVEFSELTTTQFGTILQRARELQLRELTAQPAFEGDMSKITQYQAGLEPFLVQLSGGIFEQVQGINSQYLQQAVKELEEAGKLSLKGIGFQTFDLARTEFEGIVNGPRYEQILKTLEGFGYKRQEEDIIPILKDGIGPNMRKDWKIVQYLLGEILDTEKKQLQQGLYNFPEGMFAYVPFTGYERGFTGEERTSKTSTISPIKSIPEVTEIQRQNISRITLERKFKEEEAFDRIYKSPTIQETDSRPGSRFDWMKKFPSYQPTPTQMPDRYLRNADQVPTLQKSTLPYYPTQQVPATAPTPVIINPLESLKGLFDSLKNLSTNLRLIVDNHIVLNVDRRVLADIVKQDIRDALVRYQSGTSQSVTMRIM